MYDLLIMLPNKYLCDHLTDSTTQFLVPQVCFCALCPAHISSQPSLLLYSEVSRQTLVLSLFWVTWILRAEVRWLAAALEWTEPRTPRRSPLLPPFYSSSASSSLHTLLFQSSNAFQKLPPVSCRVPLAWPTHCSCQTLPHSMGCPLGITAQTTGLGI